MCLFAVVYQVIPGCPVLVLANREESPNRPSAPPAIVDALHPGGRWLGGRDLRAGGTWLGVNQAGVIVAVTNRPKQTAPLAPKSRGLLCRELLEQGEWPAIVEEFQRQWNTELFAGLNLMLVSRERGLITSAGDTFQRQSLMPGIHAVTNGGWNDPGDARVARVRRLLEELSRSEHPLDQWLRAARETCGLGPGSGPFDVPLCVDHSRGWGTVSSAVIALTDEPGQARYEQANGFPATTPFVVYSPLLRALLGEESA